MRRAFTAILTAVVLTSSALAGSASAQGFQAVFSRDGTDVWAVGDAGSAYRSFDGGATWTSQTLGAKPLHGIAAQGFLVIVIGDDGEVRRSTNSGGSFTLTTLPGAPHLRGIEMVDAANGWIVGDAGNIFATTDGGLNWTAQTSGTSQRLNAVRFRDTANGWAVGAGGTVLHTIDGGSNWTPVTVGTVKFLRAVDYAGSTVWVVGNDATALVSPDGAVWTAQNLKIDSRSDLTGVWMDSATNVTLTGGGGFIRKSTDGGATWTFQKNPVLAETSDLYYTSGGSKGWAVHTKTRAISRTTNGGATWTTNGSESRSWVQKQPLVTGVIRGNTFALNGTNKNSVYCVMGVQVYKSANRGETWSLIGTITGGAYKTNAFYVSQTDSMTMVAATGPVPADHIARSTDGGATWTTTLTVDFSEYGVPLEMNQDKPSDLYFGPEDGRLYYSSDFGATWSILSNPGFRSPCDIQVVPDNNKTIWVGDGVTNSGQGQIFRSTDGGLTFTVVHTGSGSEIPMLASPHLNPSIGLATHWSSGGVARTTDMGATWPSVLPMVGSTWSCDFAKDDPNVCIFGVYSGGLSYHSLDAGAMGSWITTSFSGTNYGLYAPDRATLLALEAIGIYKMSVTYATSPSNTQSVTLSAPNGGEVWTAGETHNITWTATNLGVAHLEYRPNALAAWQPVADVEGYSGTYAWLVPADATTQAEIRVSDAWDGAPLDGSNATFTILAPVAAAAPAAIDFGPHGVNTLAADSVAVSNSGTAPLAATVAVSGAGFTLTSPANIVVAPAATSYARIVFQPVAATPYSGSLAVSGNFPGPLSVGLAGSGTQVAALGLDAPDGGESWQYNTVHSIAWTSAVVANLKIEYQVTTSGPWSLIADNVAAAPGSYAWTIPNAPTNLARVRVTEDGGVLVDQSANDFSITVPHFNANSDSFDIGNVTVGGSGTHAVVVTNPGAAPLVISSITDDSSEFHVGRTALVIPPLSADSIGVFYNPGDLGPDTAHFTVTADDPSSPHRIVATGTGVIPSDAGQTPTTFGIGQDGSNPFVGTTTIRYRLPQRVKVTLEVFNLQGRRVAVLVNATQAAGEYTARFGAGATTPAGDHVGQLAAGVYFAQLKAGSFSKTFKMVLAR